MKYIIFFLFVCIVFSCSNPYTNPQTSKALSEREQIEQLKQQNTLLKEQNIYLKRIAEALEKNSK